MNQYPGFVPMMVPPPYMMAVPMAPGMPPPPPPGQPLLAGAPAATLIPTSTPPAVTALPGHPAHAASHVRKRTYEETRRESIPTRGPSKWPQQEPSAKAEVGTDEPRIDEGVTALDFYNSDLNLVIDADCYGARSLTEPDGFCFTWAGARATYGVTRGKVFYEVHVIEHLPANFGEDHMEEHPHVVRVGWSINKSSYQLGEEPNSYGYGGTGKFSVNCKFSNYGETFCAGDVIGCLLDLESRPPTISYSKNGRWLGVACPLTSHPIGKENMAIFPHILSKNCKFKVNFGQTAAWFPPPPGFVYIDHVHLNERVRGTKCPNTKSECEMIMLVGLPGCGKTSWALNMNKTQPEKKYYIMGTDSLIDKMRVMGLPRKRFFHGRWDVLIQKATGCLNKMFQIASRRRKNLILDQTNVYASARKRKMRNFQGFYRKAAVLVCEDSELIHRSNKRTKEGKIIPEEAVLEMKANFTLPEENSSLFDVIEYIELPKEKSVKLVEQYNIEGKSKRPSRDKIFKHDNRSAEQSPQKPFSPRMSQGPPPPPPHQIIKVEKPQLDLPPGQRTPMLPPPPPPGNKDRFEGRQSRWGPATDVTEPPEKRIKPDPSSALDFIKQEYGGEGEENSPQWQDIHVKPESRSAYDGYGGQYTSSSSNSAAGSYGSQSVTGSYGYQTSSTSWGNRDQSTPASYNVQNPSYGTLSYQSSYSSTDADVAARSGVAGSTGVSGGGGSSGVSGAVNSTPGNWYGAANPTNTSAPPPPPPPPPMKQEPGSYNDQYPSYNQSQLNLPPQFPATDTKAWGMQSNYGGQPSQYTSPTYNEQPAYQSSNYSYDYNQRQQQYSSSSDSTYGQTEQSSYNSSQPDRSGSAQPASYGANTNQYSGYQQPPGNQGQYSSSQTGQVGMYSSDQQRSYSESPTSNQSNQYANQSNYYSGSQPTQYSSNQSASYGRNQNQYGNSGNNNSGGGGGGNNQFSGGNQNFYGGGNRYSENQGSYGTNNQSNQYSSGSGGGGINQSNQRGNVGGQQSYGGYQQGQYGNYDQPGNRGIDNNNRPDQQGYKSDVGQSANSSMLSSSGYNQPRPNNENQWQSGGRQRWGGDKPDSQGSYGSGGGYSDYSSSKPKDEVKKPGGRSENQRRTRWSDADPSPAVSTQIPEGMGLPGNYGDSNSNIGHQRSDHMNRRPDHMGGQMDQMGGRSDQMGGRSDQMRGRPDHMSNRPDHMGGRPDHMGGRSDHSGYGRSDRGGYGRSDRGNYGRSDRSSYGRSDRRDGRSDRDSRSDRDGRSDREGRSDRGDRSDRPDRGDRSDRSDRLDRSSDRADRESRSDRDSSRPERGSSDRSDRESSRTDRSSERSDRDSNRSDRGGDRSDRGGGTSSSNDKSDRGNEKTDRSSSSGGGGGSSSTADKADRNVSSSGEKSERVGSGEKSEKSGNKADRSGEKSESGATNEKADRPGTTTEKSECGNVSDKNEKTERAGSNDDKNSGDKPERDTRRSDRGRSDRDVDSSESRMDQMGRFSGPGGRMDHSGIGRPDFFPEGDRCMDMGPGQFGGFGGLGDMNRDHGPGRFMGHRGAMNQSRGPRPNFDGPRPRFDGGPRRGGPRGMAPRDHGSDFNGPGGWNQGNMRGMGPRRPPRFEGRGGPPRGMRPSGPPRWPRPH